jgi:hypothetical protein
MLEICIQTSYVQLILKSYLPVVYGTPLNHYVKDTSVIFFVTDFFKWSLSKIQTQLPETEKLFTLKYDILYNIFKIKQLSDMCVIEYGVTVEYRLTL